MDPCAIRGDPRHSNLVKLALPLNFKTMDETDSYEMSVLTRSPKTHPWQSLERLALCMMKRFYKHDWRQISQILSKAFLFGSNADRILAAGRRLDMLGAQFSDMALLRTVEFEEVYTNTTFARPFTGQLAVTQKLLERAARKVGIKLRVRQQEDLAALERFARARANSQRATRAAFARAEPLADFKPHIDSATLNDSDDDTLSQCSSRLLDQQVTGTVEDEPSCTSNTPLTKRSSDSLSTNDSLTIRLL